MSGRAGAGKSEDVAIEQGLRAASPTRERARVASLDGLRAQGLRRGLGGAGSVFALQRLIGNRSTAAVMQRELTEAAPEEVVARPKADPQPGARRGWGALRGVVDESRSFNKPMKQSSLRMDAEVEAELGPENALKFRALMGAREAREKKTTTAGGAFLASQVNSKEKIGSSAAYTSIEDRDGHLGEFLKGAHAFVSNDAYLKIRGEHLTESNFNAWGSGSNFVAPLSDADHLVDEAKAAGGRGLFQLEETLGIPKMSWVNQCKSADFGIWRFKILKPKALNLRIPSGGEYGAYGSWVDRGGAAHRGEWRPGGKTLGGAREAVIDQVGAGKFGESGEKAGEATRNKLTQLEDDGVVKIELDGSMAPNTKRVLEETKKAD